MSASLKLLIALTLSSLLLGGCYWSPNTYNDNYPGKDYKGKPEHDGAIHHQTAMPTNYASGGR